MVLEKIKEDLKKALKNGDKDGIFTLRLILSAIHNQEIAKRSKSSEVLSDEEVLRVLRTEAKKRKESIDLFKKGNREDLAKKEEKELEILSGYLPSLMSRAEIENFVDQLAKKGFDDFNSLMREAMKELKDKAEGSVVGEVVKEKLGKS